MSDWPKSLVLAGAGKMGGAMLRGWLGTGLAPAGVVVIDPLRRRTLQHLRRAPDLPSTPADNRRAGGPRPRHQAADARCGRTGPRQIAGPETLVLSIMAGKTIANLRARLQRARAFVRVMPNTPAVCRQRRRRGLRQPTRSAMSSAPGRSG